MIKNVAVHYVLNKKECAPISYINLVCRATHVDSDKRS